MARGTWLEARGAHRWRAARGEKHVASTDREHDDKQHVANAGGEQHAPNTDGEEHAAIADGEQRVVSTDGEH